MRLAALSLLLAACDVPRPEAPPIDLPALDYTGPASIVPCDPLERNGYPYEMTTVRLSGSCGDVDTRIVDARVGAPVVSGEYCRFAEFTSGDKCIEALAMVCDEPRGGALRAWRVEWSPDGLYGEGTYEYTGTDCTSVYRIKLRRL